MANLQGFIAPLVVFVLIGASCWAPNGVRAASIFSNIPGIGMLRDLTINTLDTVNNAIDGTLRRIDERANPMKECAGCDQDPDVNRNVSEIIRSRGFIAEEYNVVTKDGYILTIQRIVNPKVRPEFRGKLKPAILQHGLMSSSVDWVINSVHIGPEVYPAENETAPSSDLEDLESNEIGALVGDSQQHPNSLGFYLANKGYDVFLGNSRGNIYGQRHTKLSSWQPKFWDFTFDEQIKYDLPDTIEFVQNLTGHRKLGYVGHSQGTAMMFGLLSDRPEYADIVEPYVALAPVAYVSNSISPVKYFAIYTPVFEHINMWFATSNIAVRYLSPIVCGPEVLRKDVCANIIYLSTGFDWDEFDETRVKAYLNHMPSGTSVKNVAHYGQEVISGRFAHFDHGILGNQIAYGQTRSPDYDLSKIRSKSMVLFHAENDWLASPKDVAKLRAALTVEPFRAYNMSEFVPKWNHIDFVYAKHAGELVNTRIIAAFDHFNELKSVVAEDDKEDDDDDEAKTGDQEQ